MRDRKTGGVLFKLRGTLIRIYRGARKLRLRNRDFTIISSNCIAGIIYHDLGLPFLTPTINLYFEVDDFFRFLNHFDHYLDCEIEELRMEELDFPVGKMRCGDESVKIHFMHYQSFQEAVAKWRERAARVNKDNLYVIFEYPAINATPEEQKAVQARFDALPFARKVMLTKKHSPIVGSNVRHLRFYEQGYYPGKFVAPDKRCPFRRYLDAFNYISFLNH